MTYEDTKRFSVLCGNGVTYAHMAIKQIISSAPHGITPVLHAGPRAVGNRATDVLPFENPTFNFAKANEVMTANPAVHTHIVPDAMVSSCSECCMDEIDGKPNLIGRLFRKSRKGKNCLGCPVTAASERLPARDGDGNLMRNASGQILTEADAVRMAVDGTA